MNRRAIAEVALWSASLFAGERPASKIVRDTLLTRVRTPPDSRERFPADDDERHEVVPTERSFGSSLDPTNGAGRMTSLAPHLSVPGTLLAGAAGGGLWKDDRQRRDLEQTLHAAEDQNTTHQWVRYFVRYAHARGLPPQGIQSELQ